MKTDIHIFSPGTQTSAQGVTREFTAVDLQQVANSYNADLHEAPIRIGHEDNDKVPSWGWVKQVKMKGENLYAEVEFSPLMEDYVKNGLYKKVSASFYAPESKINPEPGHWSLRHVAMLGAQPPAVKGLKGFAYAEESADEGVLDFAVEMKLTPDQVFDEELGPTLEVDQSPLEFLKDQLDEARQEMAEEKKREADMEQELETANASLDTEDSSDTEFAEEDGEMGKKKKKASATKQGAEDADEEVEGEDDTNDNGELPPALKKAIDKKKKKSSDDDDDTSDNKEKKMDPVGKEDSDVDNDGDSDSSDEFLKKRRAAIAKDTSDNSEEDTADHAGSCGSKKKNYKEDYDEDAEHQEYETDEGEGPVAGKVKKDSKSGEAASYNEVTVPENMDSAQWEAGFKDAVDKFYTAIQVGADEVVHQEAEDQSADYLAGIEAGFEFAQTRLNRIGSEGVGSSTHDKKANDSDEVVDGEGPVASKVKKSKKDGESECCSTGDNNFGETKKKGKDGSKSSDIDDMEEDEEQHGESGKFGARGHGGKLGVDNDFGRNEPGKATKAVGRKQKGKSDSKAMGRDSDYAAKGTAPEEDRSKKGTGKPPKANGGKSKDVQTDEKTELVSVGGKDGSGKNIKGPSVRVLRFAEEQQADFSELTERLAQLEAANARLVQEKIAAERHAHRMQLEEFSESLFATGRLTPAVCSSDELVDYMEGLEYGTLEFAEGESPATKLMDLLASLPAQVSFSEIAPYDESSVPLENLDPHERALLLVKEEGLEYSEALKQTLFTVE